MVIWIIGLSASGKTTLGKEVFSILKKENPSTVLLDGDEVRRIFQHDRDKADYSMAGRKKNADRICEMCLWLDKQGINVVCCILSVFEQSRQWNRDNYSKYFEVYVDVPMDILMTRETKGLYVGAKKGEIKNVVGVDIDFPVPKNPDFIFKNDGNMEDVKQAALKIVAAAQNK